MMPRALPAAVALLLLASPAALAGWMMMGSYEPDTKADVVGGWMFTTPDVDPSQSVAKVYFNGFFGQCTDAGPCTGLNPNVATIRSSLHPPEYLLEAMLGVWKDCNKDGYVGLGDQGLFEYRTTLLDSTAGETVCPAQPTPKDPHTGKPPLNWFPSHNDGTWVREFLPIQWYDVNSVIGDYNAWNVNDQGARVWADVGLPATYHLTCFYKTYPAGTFHSTGFMLHTFDCLDGYQTTDAIDTVAASNPVLQPLSFADHPRDQENSKSLLNQRNPWGVSTDPSLVAVWDCSKPQPLSLNTPPVPQANVGAKNVLNVSAPKVPPTVDPAGSPGGTVESLTAGFDQCTRTGFGGDEPYLLESGTALPPYKTASDVMQPIEQSRPAAPFAAVLGPSAPADLGVRWLPSTCDSALVGIVGVGCPGMDGVWSGNRIYHQETVFTDANGGGLSKPVYFTYYALVSPAAISTYGLSLPKGAATGTYGAEACGSATSGILNGWDCNGADWYKDANGNSLEPSTGEFGGTTYLGERPGDAYNLRDIDCYDESFQQARGAGVGWGILTSSSCEDAP
jgi:hypothetical protein